MIDVLEQPTPLWASVFHCSQYLKEILNQLLIHSKPFPRDRVEDAAPRQEGEEAEGNYPSVVKSFAAQSGPLF